MPLIANRLAGGMKARTELQPQQRCDLRDLHERHAVDIDKVLQTRDLGLRAAEQGSECKLADRRRLPRLDQLRDQLPGNHATTAPPTFESRLPRGHADMIARACYLSLIGESFGMWMNPRVDAVSHRRMEASIVVSTTRRMETRRNGCKPAKESVLQRVRRPFIQ